MVSNGIFIFILIIALLYSVIKWATYHHYPENDEAKATAIKYFVFLEDAKKNYFSEDVRLKFHSIFDETLRYYQKHTPRNDEAKHFVSDFSTLDSRIAEINKHYIENELVRCSRLFDDVGGKSLDIQQRRAIVTDEINNLVVAGAGSGKTTTIIGKVKYLIQEKDVSPSEILLIAFTRKAAEAMTNGLKSTLGTDVEANTFHKLGLDIIKENRVREHDIDGDNSVMRKVIHEHLKNALKNNDEAAKQVIEFLVYHFNNPIDVSDYDSLGEYYADTNNIDLDTLRYKYEKNKYELKTIKQERVKSMEEVSIANYLFLNGIDYKYESLYQYPVNDQWHKKYRPDFYLPQFDIYIEHFGIDRNNRAPWLSEIEENKYIDSMEWKRKTHSENGTTLIETYSYFNATGELLTTLDKKLVDAGVEKKTVNTQEIYNVVFASSDDRQLEEFIKLISCFIKLFKSNGYKSNDFERMKKEASAHPGWICKREIAFFNIVQPIFEAYNAELDKSDLIDFDDMILIARNYVEENGISKKYRYIIIDEFQDISVSRFKLVKSIVDVTGAKLLCVGDDWQSIYRFTGSDIDFFFSFEKYFGKTERMLIERTYRNSQELIDIAGNFVMTNKHQFEKRLVSSEHVEHPIQPIIYGSDINLALGIALDHIVQTRGSETDVLLLGRTKYDAKLILPDNYKENNTEKYILFEDKPAKSENHRELKCKKYPGLNITFLTAHKAKGLECSNVILLDMANKLLGFPNHIFDDPILSWVLTNKDEYPFAEERRLFYVAITRTKCRTYLLAPEEDSSPFLLELIKKNNLNPILSADCETYSNPRCPKCKTGALKLRHSEYGDFLGCTNFNKCDYILGDINILNNPIKCTQCGGYMEVRSGPYGQYIRCSNYPICKNTLRK